MRSSLAVCVAVLVSVFCSYSIAFAGDWHDCTGALKEFVRTADHAFDASRVVESRERDLESKKNNLERAESALDDCRSNPAMYDTIKDRCQNLSGDHDSALDGYHAAVNEYENAKKKLHDMIVILESRLQSVESSCRRKSGARLIPSGSGDRVDWCSYIKGQAGTTPDSELMELCKKYMSEENCKECLGIPLK